MKKFGKFMLWLFFGLFIFVYYFLKELNKDS